MKKLLTVAVLTFAGGAVAQDLTLKVSQPLELSGGLTGAYLYTTNDNSKDSRDGFRITNAVVNLKGSSGQMGFDLALGAFLVPTVWDGGVGNDMISYTTGDTTGNEAGILWGYVSYSPVDKVTLDAGLLTTNIGYEVVNTYANPNVTLGAVWNAQPVIYPGARITLEVAENISVYAEYNGDTANQNAEEAFALGSIGSLGEIDYAVSYYDYAGFKNLVDVVLSYSVGSVDLGLNVDYQWLDDAPAGRDDSAYGVAVYLIPSFGNVTVPVRLEYFDEGTSRIYYPDGEAEKGYTVTVTPTLKPADNSFVRAEVSYISTDREVFSSGTGTEDNKATFAVELGFTF